MPQNFELQPVFLQSGDPETESVSTLHAPGTLGARFTVVQPTRTVSGEEEGRAKRYQLVKTDSSMTVAPYKGATAAWSDQKGYVVTTSNANRNRPAGVFQRAWAAAGDYMCIQIGGVASTKLLDADVGAAAIGDSIILSTTDGKATRVAVGTAPTHVPLGRVAGPPISTTPAEALVVVDLDLPETV